MRILNEGSEVWRPVFAEQSSEGTFHILVQKVPPNEEWEFEPGHYVKVESKVIEGAERLAAVSLVMNDKTKQAPARIEVLEYQDRWPYEFRDLAMQIRKVVGSRALAIHHIGSTSIPEMPARDVIDIQVTVSEFFDDLDSELLKIGFEKTVHRLDRLPKGMLLQELTKRHYVGTKKKVNLYVRKHGAFNQRYALLFRDYLRTHSVAMRAYGEIKVKLARHLNDGIEAYDDVKAPICDAIMEGAWAWEKQTQWQPGASDI